MLIGQHEFQRVHRIGGDRLYVIRCRDGVQLGYWDLTVDTPHPASAGSTG